MQYINNCFLYITILNGFISYGDTMKSAFFILSILSSGAFINCFHSYEYKYDDFDEKLLNDTALLIDTTLTTFSLIYDQAESQISKTLDNINSNVNILQSYSVNRTSGLITYLLDEIDQSQKYSDDYTMCLTTVPFIKTMPDNFKLRIELALNTAIRVGNATVRSDVLIMDRSKHSLNVIKSSLLTCTTNACILSLSEQVELLTIGFMKSFNDILLNMATIAGQIQSEAIKAANNTLYEDEEYACSNAKLVIQCIKTFNDGNDEITTIFPEPTATTPSTTIPTATPTTTTTTTTTTTESTTIQTTTEPHSTTPSPVVALCSHPPFNPPSQLV